MPRSTCFLSLTGYFSTSLKRAVATGALEKVAKIQIVHVYGTLGPVPGDGSDLNERWYDPNAHCTVLLEAAKRMFIVAEAESSPHLDKARNILSGASVIIILGFGFDPTNVRILGLDSLAEFKGPVYASVMMPRG